MTQSHPVVYFVDSDFAWSMPLREELQRHAVRIILIDSIRELEESIDRLTPHVAVITGNVTGGDRIVVLRVLRMKAPAARLVVLEAPGLENIEEFARTAPLLHYGHKPADSLSLHATLKTALPHATGERRTGTPLIFCIDDDPLYLRSLERILTHQGYRVASFSKGDEALAAIETRQPALAIVDVMMPEMNGLNLADEILETYGGRIPVVLLTARGADKDIIEGYRHGATYYITKPCSPRTVINIVDYLVGGFDRIERERLETLL